MKKRRTALWEKGPRVRGICTWCQGPVQKPKIYWCSEECIHEHKLRSDPQYLRAQTFARDQGVCAKCGLDTEMILRAYREAQAQAVEGINERFKALGFKLDHDRCPSISRPRHMWEADHRIPVAEGGGECGLENIVTLCLSCHRAKTAEQAKRRAEQRKKITE